MWELSDLELRGDIASEMCIRNRDGHPDPGIGYPDQMHHPVSV